MTHQPNPALLTTSITTTLDDIHVCTIRGEIDIRTAPMFRKALFDGIAVGGTTVVDMTAVTFFGVAGICALVEALDIAHRRQCELCVEGSHCVTRVLEVVGLATAFDICE
ncbi:STAS domain-containing protein [Nocardia tengchongensis]|uniref:STAS domain-containing protein n=1 Tax=Nocardia tengchongensis TaxID=2055889 RepID=A0ABX8CJG5_9NOCA|nr:STAS domain-containing protein [Nocardia tengchongensis]QVI19679.1 STAS domain-containing protein [Nocardia tengchongensis]